MRSIILAAAALATAGCYSTYDVSPRSLEALDGFRAGERRSVDAVQFDDDTELRFAEPIGTAAKFSAIEVEGDTLRGVTRPSGEELTIDLRRVGSVRARKFSAEKTAEAIGVPVGVVLVVALVTLAVFAAAHPCLGVCIGTF